MAALCGVAPLLLAQTTPKPAAKAAAAKPAAAPAAAKPAEGKTLSMGGGTASGPILSRDELRACLTRDESVRARTVELDGRRTPMDKEKQALAADQQALVAERAPIDEIKRRAEDLNARMRAYGTRVEAWNQHVAEFNASNRTGAQGDRERGDLNKERDALQLLQKDLEAEKTRIGSDSEVAVRAFNAKAADLDARVADWNQRNNQLNQAAKDADADRQAWVAACANRRYREDDETAIRQGK